MLHREVDDLRKQLEEKSRETEMRLGEIKEKTRSLLDAKEMEMRSLNETNI